MQTQYNRIMNKLQLTLTDQEAQILTAQANRLGYSLARYAKFLLSGAAAQSLGLTKGKAFFDVFNYPTLSKVRDELLASDYSHQEADDLVAALRELPGYDEN